MGEYILTASDPEANTVISTGPCGEVVCWNPASSTYHPMFIGYDSYHNYRLGQRSINILLKAAGAVRVLS